VQIWRLNDFRRLGQREDYRLMEQLGGSGCVLLDLRWIRIRQKPYIRYRSQPRQLVSHVALYQLTLWANDPVSTRHLVNNLSYLCVRSWWNYQALCIRKFLLQVSPFFTSLTRYLDINVSNFRTVIIYFRMKCIHIYIYIYSKKHFVFVLETVHSSSY